MYVRTCMCVCMYVIYIHAYIPIAIHTGIYALSFRIQALLLYVANLTY